MTDYSRPGVPPPHEFASWLGGDGTNVGGELELPNDNIIQPAPGLETANQQPLVHPVSPIEHAINEQDGNPPAQQSIEPEQHQMELPTNQQQMEFTFEESINK